MHRRHAATTAITTTTGTTAAPRRRPRAQLARVSRLALLLGAPAAAQEPPPDPVSLIPIDRVVATINDAVILHSEVITIVKGQIESARRLGQMPTRHEVRRLFQEQLERRVDEHALAQSAKTLGILPPDRVEELFQQELREDEADMVRDFGSVQKYDEEIARQGSWSTFVAQQRVEKLSRMAQQMSVTTRLQNQDNLFITPRMMREFYRRNRALFVHDAGAVVGMVAFVGADARAAAAAAAAEWRTTPYGPDQLARRFADRGARSPTAERVDETTRRSLHESIYEFGIAGPEGRVSEPIARGEGVYWVYKVLQFRAASDASFSDPEVQHQIRAQLRNQVYNVLMAQTIQRAHDRTYVWITPELDREGSHRTDTETGADAGKD